MPQSQRSVLGDKTVYTVVTAMPQGAISPKLDQ